MDFLYFKQTTIMQSYFPTKIDKILCEEFDRHWPAYPKENQWIKFFFFLHTLIFNP